MRVGVLQWGDLSPCEWLWNRLRVPHTKSYSLETLPPPTAPRWQHGADGVPSRCQQDHRVLLVPNQLHWLVTTYRLISWHFTGFMLAVLANPTCRLGTRVSLAVTERIRKWKDTCTPARGTSHYLVGWIAFYASSQHHVCMLTVKLCHASKPRHPPLIKGTSWIQFTSTLWPLHHPGLWLHAPGIRILFSLPWANFQTVAPK